MSIGLSKLRKHHHPPHVGGYQPARWGPEKNRMAEGRRLNLVSVCLSWDIHLLLPWDVGHSLLVSRLLNPEQELRHSQVFGLTLNCTLVFLVLWLADGRGWDFLVSVTLWANRNNKSPLIYISIYILMVRFPWRTLIHSIFVISKWPILLIIPWKGKYYRDR